MDSSTKKTKINRKIGILTWHYYVNVGSQLQAYALMRSIDKLGYHSFFINYHNPKFGVSNKYKTFIKLELSKIAGNIIGKLKHPELEFQEKYFNQTVEFYDATKVKNYCNNCHAIIFGSDQIWAPNVFNSIYMGEGLDGKCVRKISYAASIGLTRIPYNLHDIYLKLLKDFHSVSVREEAGKILLDEEFKIESKVVLDPTLLLDIREYKSLEIKVSMPSKYVFCYFLNKEHNYSSPVIRYAREHNLKIYGISSKEENWMNQLKNISPGQFLWLIHNAEAVFTDSYHGTIFSLLYHKIFFVFERFLKNDPLNQNSRIYQLDNWFGIKNRVISSGHSMENALPTNYELFEKHLSDAREYSLDYLRKALE